MKINAIGGMTFAGKEQIAKTATKLATVASAAFVTNTALQGLSKPNKDIEADTFVKAHDDDDWNPCDSVSDAICD